jgi:2Fe-2S ferredoxin
MPQITYVSPDGAEMTVDAKLGSTVMHTALHNNIGGIVAECGGNATCATCHVYVHEAQADQLPPIEDYEEEMLQCTSSPRKDTSRLSCQIAIIAERDGLVVRLPETQVDL